MARVPEGPAFPPSPVTIANALSALVLVQWAAGIANVLLLAPIWLQLVHLLLADLVWITLVLLTARALADRRRDRKGFRTALESRPDGRRAGPVSPATLHPRLAELVTLLRDARAELLNVLNAVSFSDATRRPSDDGWSVAQIAEHLRLVEVVGRPDARRPREADRSRGARTRDRHELGARRARSLSVRGAAIPAAGAADRDPGRRCRPYGRLSPRSAKSRQRLLGLIDRVNGRALGRLTYPHPRLGALSFYEWILFLGQHERRHAAQAREVIAMLRGMVLALVTDAWPPRRRLPAQAVAPALPYQAMAARIVAALQPARGERAILRGDDRAMPELIPPLRDGARTGRRRGVGARLRSRGGPQRRARAFEHLRGVAARAGNRGTPAGSRGAQPVAGLGRRPAGPLPLDQHHHRHRRRAHYRAGILRSSSTSRRSMPTRAPCATAWRAPPSSCAIGRSGSRRRPGPTSDSVSATRPICLQDGNATQAAVAGKPLRIDKEIELPAGVLRVAPLEETVAGTLVIPILRIGSDTARMVQLDFSKGRVTDVRAESGAEAVRAMLAKAPALTGFRELGIGFNPALVVPPNEPAIPYAGYGAGMVRLSLGDNRELGGRGVGRRRALALLSGCDRHRRP